MASLEHLPEEPKSVTHVSGITCYPSLRKGTEACTETRCTILPRPPKSTKDGVMAVLFAAPAVVIAFASASPVAQFVEIRASVTDAPELFLRRAEFETALKEAKR